MPFTLAHPAAILYFKHKFKKLSATGLIAGSMGPDLGYFARFEIDSRLEHSWLYSGFVVVPFSILFSVLYHCLIKRNFVNNLPVYFKSRMIHWNDFNFIEHIKNQYWTYVLCVIIGIYTHLIWDSFTHFDGFFVVQFDVLQIQLLGLPIFKWLQYGGSIVGMLILALYFHSLPASPEVCFSYSIKYTSFTIMSAIAMILIRFLLFPIQIKIGNLLVVCMSALFFSLSMAGLISNIRKSNTEQN